MNDFLKQLLRVFVLVYLACSGHSLLAQSNPLNMGYSNINRFVLINNDQEVFDLKTGLVWLRCRKDTQWNGTACANTAPHTGSDYLTAMNFAKSQGAWRMPNIKELTSLLDSGAFVKKGVPSYVNRLHGLFNAYTNIVAEPTLLVWSNTPYFKEINNKYETPVLGGFYVLRFDTGVIKPGIIGSDQYDVMLVKNGDPNWLPKIK